MKRLLSTTTVLSLALAPVHPVPVFAQGLSALGQDMGLTQAEDGSIIASDGTVVCAPTPEAPCDLQSLLGMVQVPEADAEAEAAAEAAAAEAAAAEAAAAEAAAAEAAAAEAAAAEAVAAEAAAAEAAAAEAAAAEAAVEPEVIPEDAAPEAAENVEPSDAPAVEEVVEEQVTEEAAPEAPADDTTAQTPVEAVPEAEAEPATEAAEAAPEPAADPAVEATAETAPDAESAPAEQPVAEAEPVDVPVVTEEENRSLLDLLTAQPAAEAETDGEVSLPAAAAAIGALMGGAAAGSDDAAEQPAPADVTVTTVTEDTTRSSAEEFAAAPSAVSERQRSGLSDLEKVGLLALGALVVGAVLSDGREVVENTGDRVVVRDPQGNYSVYKDDDTLLRRPGSTVRTETFSDGSTRSIVEREDGTQVVTIRDASGRVLRRATYDARGNEVVLINDLVREERIDVSTLPRPRPDRVTISTNDGDAALKAALAAEEARAIGRSFSLRQIREIPQVRALAATIDVDNVTFDSGSAVIRPSEARKLASLGRIITDILADNPNEVFLIEGHTDAVGSASYNLTLSDRRAESVALALTEYYGVPPENMVVQGYGESELRVETQADERRNRRAVLRVITPLLQTASLR
jgi:outer membrane protein OmpA-like peptidoglycan-associated protein